MATLGLLISSTLSAQSQEWFSQVLKLQETSQQLLDFAIQNLDTDTGIYKISGREAYDHSATLTGNLKSGSLVVAEVDWDSKKTGLLPQPEKASIRALIKSQNTVEHHSLQMEELVIGSAGFYRSRLQFAQTLQDTTPIRRGIAEIFQDIEKQQVKISLSYLEGMSDVLPENMIQTNVQAIVGPTGYIYLRQEEAQALKIPDNQEHFCRNPEGEMVSPNSAEWKESCEVLFDNSNWHGFAFNELPNSYRPFIKIENIILLDEGDARSREHALLGQKQSEKQYRSNSRESRPQER